MEEKIETNVLRPMVESSDFLSIRRTQDSPRTL